ncbi:MAG: GNAT family N-acetyltransferase [Anaerolineae bacterium]|nr:GNAT family N-acetyltransferase [Anaerolineae bacterium]
MITIRPPRNPAEVRLIEVLQRQVWGMDDLAITPYNTLHALEHAGGLLLLAFDGEHPIGFTFGFPGYRGGKSIFWSHMTGVLPEYQRQGIGRKIKFAQRQHLMERGYTAAGWTFDPLRQKNAVFNIAALGAVCRQLHIELYGEMSDGINAGLVSDRFEVEWPLTHPHVEKLSNSGQPAFARSVLSEFYVLRVANGEPLLLNYDYTLPEAAIELPAAVDQMRQKSPEKVRRWYHALREAIIPLFDAGYWVDQICLSPDVFAYVLRRDKAWYLYVLETAAGTFYTGIATDVEKRLKQHNTGKGAKYTSLRRPVKVVAVWETFGRSRATQLEYAFKQLSRSQKIRMVASHETFLGAKRVQ